MNTIKVLDHGFVTLRNIAGPTRRNWQEFDARDVDVANAARMSFGTQDIERTYAVEMKLNKFLLEHRHMTPFEVIEVWLEMKLPIFTARQFVRHRTTSLNEISGRYVTLPAEWYIPEVVGGKPTDKKQGQTDTLAAGIQEWFKVELNDACAADYRTYLKAIECGVAHEHARLFLHVNHYTQWLWKQDLRNLMHFLSLRAEEHAQTEAQRYGLAVMQLIEPTVPGIVGLFKELQLL